MRFCHVNLLTQFLVVLNAQTSAALALSASPAFDTIRRARVMDPRSGELCSPFETGGQQNQKTLVVVLPQLGEFDSSEMCEQLVAVQSQLAEAKVTLRVIGIGDVKAAETFSKFTALPLDVLRVDPDATLHRELDLHAGPNWDLPDSVSDDVLKFLLGTLPGGAPSDSSSLRSTGRAWFNYLAMCAGIGAPGTLREILRGYFGDLSAPERFRQDDTVEAGFITIGPGVGPVKVGPFQYSQWFSDERGYQRPVELATVRLKNMVEVLTKWDEYVSNPAAIDQRGATYLFDEGGEIMYQYRHKGVLTYSETMERPLSFLAPYIGNEVASNPLQLPDNRGVITSARGRGILKPAGRFMSLLKPIFAPENKLQAQLVFGAEEDDFAEARRTIKDAITSNHVVIYTYGLSPFSSEAVALLEDAGCTTYKKIELGLEWFLLGKEESTIRAELLAMTGQSSLPHIFIGGKHVGGLFSGTDDGGPGIAALQEAGELKNMLAHPSS